MNESSCSVLKHPGAPVAGLALAPAAPCFTQSASRPCACTWRSAESGEFPRRTRLPIQFNCGTNRPVTRTVEAVATSKPWRRIRRAPSQQHRRVVRRNLIMRRSRNLDHECWSSDGFYECDHLVAIPVPPNPLLEMLLPPIRKPLCHESIGLGARIAGDTNVRRLTLANLGDLTTGGNYQGKMPQSRDGLHSLIGLAKG